MSLVFAAIVPHSPLLLDHIGKSQTEKLGQTRKAFDQLQDELYGSRVDCLLIISAHAGKSPDAFTVLGNNTLTPDLSDFGDLQEYSSVTNHLPFVSSLRESADEQGIPLIVDSSATLDYASSIPLMLLSNDITDPTIAVIGTSDLDRKTHFDFGYVLKDIVMNSTTRYGILLSCDLAHTLSTDAPAGFSRSGEQFDTTIRQRLQDYNSSALLQLDDQIAQEADQCALPALLIFLGLTQRMGYQYKELSYEFPFGVGYLTGQFIL